MNIFATSVCPVESASFLDDKRIISQTKESAQMLCTALREHGIEDERLYKSTHKNHPANVWCRTTNMNFTWLLTHFEALLDQYTARYGKRHASERLLPLFYEYMDVIPVGTLQNFANCAANKEFGVDFKDIKPVTLAYKKYLIERWKRDKLTPTWFKQPISLETEVINEIV